MTKCVKAFDQECHLLRLLRHHAGAGHRFTELNPYFFEDFSSEILVCVAAAC